MKFHFSLCPSTHWAPRPIGLLYPAYKAGLAEHLPVIQLAVNQYIPDLEGVAPHFLWAHIPNEYDPKTARGHNMQ